MEKPKERILRELMKGENWKPNLSQINKKINVPISTIFDHYIRYKKAGQIKVSVEIFGVEEKIRSEQEEKNGKRRNIRG